MHFSDIVAASSRIERFIAGCDFPSYETDDKTRSAVERQLQIITEAAYRLDASGEAITPGVDWDGLRGMGNLLRHAYHRRR